LILSKPTIAIHDERDVRWNFALSEYPDCLSFRPRELQHTDVANYYNTQTMQIEESNIQGVSDI